VFEGVGRIWGDFGDDRWRIWGGVLEGFSYSCG
jgi:hypothetical protein